MCGNSFIVFQITHHHAYTNSYEYTRPLQKETDLLFRKALETNERNKIKFQMKGTVTWIRPRINYHDMVDTGWYTLSYYTAK